MGEIQIGYQVGRLTLEEPTGRRKSGYMVWRCRCGCLSRPPLKEFRRSEEHTSELQSQR